MRRTGRPRGLAGRRQVLGPTLERGRVGQNREAGRAALRIGAGERGRIEVGADQPFRGTGLLDLGDQRRTAGGKLTLDSGHEAARGRSLGRPPPHRVGRDRGLGGLNLPPLVDLYPCKDVAHAAALFETATRRSSAALAAPESTACAARATPSRRSPAASAMTRAAAALKTAMSRYGVRAPSSTARSSAALWAGSPPRTSSGRARARPDLLRRDRERPQRAVLQRRHMGRAGRGDLVEAVGPVHGPDALGAKLLESLGERFEPCHRGNAEELARHAGWIGERPQQVEDRARAQFHPHRRDVAHGNVMGLGEHEAQVRFAQTAREMGRIEADLDAKRGQHVGRARFGRGGAVAVLGDRHAAACHDHGGERGDVVAAGLVAAGADRRRWRSRAPRRAACARAWPRPRR